MGLSILNNIPSLEAQNQLAITNKNLQNVLFQLSSGSKINSGADDPAGLSIANGLQANISALTQSAQNVTDGVGMLQTADGALSQVTTLLNRAVTLATEGGNEGLTTAQQQAIQNEFNSITTEINQIGSNTTYNNTSVFTGALTSVFLSDGSQTDAADPTISVTIPNLSAQALGLSSYATGTLDLTANPQAGNTVQIGQQVYTFVASGQATAAGDVALGTNVQGTLQNLQNAVNGTGDANPGTYGVGTSANQSAQITAVNGGSATVQALAAGAVGNNVHIITNLTSNAGTSGATMTGATNQTYNNATLTLNAQPGTLGTATGSVTMTALPDTITTAQGNINFGATQPVAGNATATLTILTATPAVGDKVTVGGGTYTFVAQGSIVGDAGAGSNDIAIATGGSLQVNLTNTLQNLSYAVNGAGGVAGVNYSTGSTASGTALITGITSTASSASATVASVSPVGATGDAVPLTALFATPANVSAPGGGTLAGGGTSDTITVGSQIYTFVAYGTATTGNEVALGNSAVPQTAVNETLQNFAAAVNGIVGGTVNTFSPTVSANTTATMTYTGPGAALVTAITPGVGNGVAGATGTGNSTRLVASGTISTAVDPTGTLSGGAAADTVTIGGQTYTFVAAGTATGANDVAEGNSGVLATDIQTTLQHLAGAVNGAYTGMVAGISTWGATSTPAGTATISAISSGVASVTAAAAGAGTNTGSAATDTGNWIGISATSPQNLISATAMSGGSNADTVTIGNVTYTFVAAGTQMTSGNQVALGTATTSNGVTTSAVQNTLNNLMAAVNATTASTGTQTAFFVTNLQGTTGGTIASDANGVAKIQALTSTDIGLNAVFGGGNATGTLGSLTTATLSGGAAAVGNTAATNATGMINLAGGQPAIGNATSTLTATANVTANDTVLVNNQTYTFTAASSVTNNTVIVGATLQQSLQNLQDVVNGVGGVAGVNYGTGTNTAATGEVLSSFTTSGNTGTATFAATAIGVGGNGLALTYTNTTGTPITSSGVSAGGSATPDYVTIGGYNYTFVAANAAVANNEVALGVASGTPGTPTYVSAVQATLNNLKAAVNSTNVNNGTAATYHLTAGNLQNAGTGANIGAVNGAQAVVTSNLAGVGNGTSTGNSTVLSYTSNAATTNFAGSAAAGQAATQSSGFVNLVENPENGNSLTIGNTTYTFVSSAPTTANQVYIGATANGTLTNLEAAVNGTAGAGNTYGTGTVQNPLAQITAVNGTGATLQSVGTGIAQNSIALSDSITNGAAGGVVPTPTTLTGGAVGAQATGTIALVNNLGQGDTVTIGNKTYTFVTSTPAAAYQVMVGNSITQTLNNLQEALANGPAGTGSGSVYGTGTALNGSATITSVSGDQATVTATNDGTAGNNTVLMVGNGNSLGGGGSSVSLSSAPDSQAALTVIAGAISTVAATRGAIGSSINEMNAALDVMNNTSQNLTSSMSSIQDANIGQVIANMSKFQILEQTGIAALAQSNTSEQAILRLLP